MIRNADNHLVGSTQDLARVDIGATTIDVWIVGEEDVKGRARGLGDCFACIT